MEKSTLAKAFDFLFMRLLIFFGSYIILSYYFSDKVQILLISLSVVIIVHVLLKLIFSKKRSKTLTKSKDEKHKKQCLNEFLLSTNESNLKFFYNLVLKLNPTTVMDSKYIRFTNKGEKCAAVVAIKTAPISVDDILSSYQELKDSEVKSLIVFANAVPDEIHVFSEQLELPAVTVLDVNDIYEVMKGKDYFPQLKEKSIKKKKKLKFFAELFFNKRCFFPYLFTAVSLFLFSFFAPFKTYYMIFSGVCFILAFISKLNTRFNIPSKKRIAVLVDEE